MSETKELTVTEQKQVIIDWLNGEDKKEIAKRHGVTTRMVTSIVNTNHETRLELEKQYFAVPTFRENRRIAEIKDKMLTFLEDSLEEGIEKENKHLFIDKFKGMLDSIDRIQRLNNDQPTENTKQTNVNYNIAEIAKTLKTPEQKKHFLLEKLKEQTTPYEPDKKS